VADPSASQGRGHFSGQGTGADLTSLDPETRQSVRILVIDDDRALRESTASFLGTEGYSVTVCGRGDEALGIVKRRKFDIMLVDLYMSQVPGIELLNACLATHRDTIVIVMTGNPSVSSSVETLEAGAWDYLPKPFSATHLQLLIGRAAHTVLVGRETQAIQAELDKKHGNSEKVNVLGRSPAFKKVIELARRVAVTDASVFITGESGTGKELIAEFIHHHSRRSSRPFVAVNCPALPEALLESEMFGHRKGAFTGAIREKPGLLEAANGGTLFLDELIEMSMPIQAKLLRAIQDGVVRRVGSETTDAVVNVRFVAATNRDPAKAMADGLLREDLYYRLRVVPIHVPPLRDRPEDLPLLANHFLRHYWNRHREKGTPIPHLSEAAMRALRTYPWPGNVRELQNVFEHAVVILEPGSVVQPSDIPFIGDAVGAPAPEPAETSSREFSGTPIDLEEAYQVARDRLVAEFELRYLGALIRRARGNVSRASRLAGIDRATLYRLMEKHGLQRETLAFGSE
jgi:DNA-binding NtrC family response regulator